MNVPFNRRKPIAALLLALAVASPMAANAQSLLAGAPVLVRTAHLASPQTAADRIYAQNTEMRNAAGSPQSRTESSAAAPNATFPVLATERPAPAGTGANPGDAVRAEMQSHVHSFHWPWQHG